MNRNKIEFERRDVKKISRIRLDKIWIDPEWVTLTLWELGRVNVTSSSKKLQLEKKLLSKFICTVAPLSNIQE